MCPWRDAGLDEKALRDAAATHAIRDACCDPGASALLACVMPCDAQLLG